MWSNSLKSLFAVFPFQFGLSCCILQSFALQVNWIRCSSTPGHNSHGLGHIGRYINKMMFAGGVPMYSQFTIHNSQFSIRVSIHNSQFTILNQSRISQFSIYNSQFLVHNSQFWVQNSQFFHPGAQFSIRVATQNTFGGGRSQSDLGQPFLDAIASPSTYPCQWVGQSVSGSVIHSFRFGDSYRISELCELVWYLTCIIKQFYKSENIDLNLKNLKNLESNYIWVTILIENCALGYYGTKFHLKWNIEQGAQRLMNQPKSDGKVHSLKYIWKME